MREEGGSKINSPAFFIPVLYSNLGLGLWNLFVSTILLNAITLNLGVDLRPHGNCLYPSL